MATTRTLTFQTERMFDCSPEELWEAWTTAEEFAQWISPFPGRAAEVLELDAREGGRIRFVMIGPSGERFPAEEGIFRVFDPPRELVLFQPNSSRDDLFKGFALTMRVRFEAVGAKTRMRFEHSGYPPTFPMDEARRGFTACFDKLSQVIASR